MITLELLATLHRDWQKSNKALRFGQLFCNTHNVSDQKLFYEPDSVTAYNYIVEHYLVTDTPIQTRQQDSGRWLANCLVGDSFVQSLGDTEEAAKAQLKEDYRKLADQLEQEAQKNLERAKLIREWLDEPR